MRLPVEMSESQFTEELVAGKRDGKIQMRWNNFQVFFSPSHVNNVCLRLFCAWHDMWLILAVVEVCSSTQLFIFPSFSKVL